MSYTKARPVVDIANLKRKRTCSSGSVTSCSLDALSSKKRRETFSDCLPEEVPDSQPSLPDLDVVEIQPEGDSHGKRPDVPISAEPPDRDDAPDEQTILKMKFNPERLAKAQEKIQAQINLEILLKHNELRLIEQELAKCQVALEQLRRCQIIPYPGQIGSDTDPEQITTGTGAALRPEPGLSRPRHPTPWGVIDGPYTRHYATWLLPAPQFDPGQPDTPRSVPGRYPILGIEGRATRGNVEGRIPASASRAQRGSRSQFHAIATNYSTPRERSGPLIATRPDGTRVKLVCNFCQAENSVSLQGFLNHCRIAHGKVYKTHPDAIRECGQPLDEIEARNATTSTVAEQPSGISIQQVDFLSLQKSLVHPLIMSAHAVGNGTFIPPPGTLTTPLVQALPRAFSVSPTRQRPRPYSIMTSPQPFIPSSQTPYLSALLQKSGSGGDLNKLVASSQERIDLDQVATITREAGDDNDDEGQAARSAASKRGGSAPSRNSPAKGRTPATATFARGRVPVPLILQTSSATATQLSQMPHRLHMNTGTRTTIPNSSSQTIASSSFPAPITTPDSSHPEVPETPPQHVEMAQTPHAVDWNPGFVTDVDDNGAHTEFESPLSPRQQAHGYKMNEAVAGSQVEVRRDSDVTMHDSPGDQGSGHAENTVGKDFLAAPATAGADVGVSMPAPEQSQKKRKRGRPTKRNPPDSR